MERRKIGLHIYQYKRNSYFQGQTPPIPLIFANNQFLKIPGINFLGSKKNFDFVNLAKICDIFFVGKFLPFRYLLSTKENLRAPLIPFSGKLIPLKGVQAKIFNFFCFDICYSPIFLLSKIWSYFPQISLLLILRSFT